MTDNDFDVNKSTEMQMETQSSDNAIPLGSGEKPEAIECESSVSVESEKPVWSEDDKPEPPPEPKKSFSEFENEDGEYQATFVRKDADSDEAKKRKAAAEKLSAEADSCIEEELPPVQLPENKPHDEPETAESFAPKKEPKEKGRAIKAIGRALLWIIIIIMLFALAICVTGEVLVDRASGEPSSASDVTPPETKQLLTDVMRGGAVVLSEGNANYFAKDFADYELYEGVTLKNAYLEDGRLHANVYVDFLDANFPLSAEYSISYGDTLELELSDIYSDELKIGEKLLGFIAQRVELPDYVSVRGGSVVLSVPDDYIDLTLDKFIEEQISSAEFSGGFATLFGLLGDNIPDIIDVDVSNIEVNDEGNFEITASIIDKSALTLAVLELGPEYAAYILSQLGAA